MTEMARQLHQVTGRTKRRYRVRMRRQRSLRPGRYLHKEVYTHAYSAAQAKRFAHKRYPGWSATTAKED